MRARTTLVLLTAACLLPLVSRAQQAQQLVQKAVDSELQADRNDHSLWHYRMAERQENNTIYDVVDTSNGEIKQKIEVAGHVLTVQEQHEEAARVSSFLADAHAQAKQKRDGEHDDKSAEKMLNLLPVAFIWTMGETRDSETTLHFTPDPNFKAPDIESRVLAAMQGDLVIDRRQFRIATIRGQLTHDVDIGFGILGRLRQGGTFNVERRQLAPGVWQITETHVHIDGRALLFKTIGQQTDEVKYDFHRIPETTTLTQGATMIAFR